MTGTYLWYIPSQTDPGHRGEPVSRTTTAWTRSPSRPLRWSGTGGRARCSEQAGDDLTPSPWPPHSPRAQRPSSPSSRSGPATGGRPTSRPQRRLDHLTNGRVRVNVVSGKDDLPAYGDVERDDAQRYARTKEFLQVVRRLWTHEDVTFAGEHYQITHSTVRPRITVRGDRTHPTLYFGGASTAAERVSAAEADVQLFWGEPWTASGSGSSGCGGSARSWGASTPLQYGLRVTTLVRDTSEQAWADAEAKVAEMASQHAPSDEVNPHRRAAVGQQRLFDLTARGEVLDSNLYTTPGKYGAGGAATTWLVGSADEVAKSLRRYADLGITHFVLSDTPYLREIERQGEQLLPLLHG